MPSRLATTWGTVDRRVRRPHGLTDRRGAAMLRPNPDQLSLLRDTPSL